MVNFYTYLEIFLEDLHKLVSLSEFETYFNRPHQTIKSHLNEFVKKKVLKEDKRKKFLFYKLNLDNPLTKEYLILCEKERLLDFLSRNTLFSRLYHALSEYFHDSSILLFGSSTKAKTYNDIDMLILSENKELKKALKEFEQIYSKKIHLIQTKEKDLTKALIKEIRQKHIIFNNHSYFIEVLYR